MRVALSALLLLAACGGSDDDSGPDAGSGTVTPTANADREIIDTKLAFDVTGLAGTATITFGPSATPGATLEVGDLMLTSATYGDSDLAYDRKTTTETTKSTIDLALPASDAPTEVTFAWTYVAHAGFAGWNAKGFTLTWPYFCGNLFPCHSEPSDGTTTSLELMNVPAGKMAIYPESISEAPSYMLAWTVDAYTELSLGTTTAGTQVSAWHRGGNEAAATATGTAHLVAAFDWLETHLGPYRFGSKVGSISVNWGGGALGGMKHHPMWHLASSAMGDEETHVHEAAHGWYGDGVRLQCWEDFVLSEGTTSYLAGRALEAVAPAVGAAIFDSYKAELPGIAGTDLVWPQSCGSVDIIADDLFTRAPYVRGALFYRALADKVSVAKVDEVLQVFYAAHAGKAGKMADMLTTIQTVTGYDPTACAATWLTSTTTPTYAACP